MATLHCPGHNHENELTLIDGVPFVEGMMATDEDDEYLYFECVWPECDSPAIDILREKALSGLAQ